MTTETILPDGLSTSVLGSSYKAEYDQNLALLDVGRIHIIATAANLPAVHVPNRFFYTQDVGAVYFDNGTAYTTGAASTAGSMLVKVTTDYAPIQTINAVQDILFNNIVYRLGSLSNATLDATGGIVIPAGVNEIRLSTRVSFNGAAVGVPVGVQLAVLANHAAVLSEAASQVYYTVPNGVGWIPLMINAPASINVFAGDVIDTAFMFNTAAMAPNIAASDSASASATWMYIEAI